MQNWARAPPEILLQCFDSFGALTKKYASLTACALVCRGWLPCAQSVLYYCVVPREHEYSATSRESVEQLVRVLADGSARGAALAAEVRVLKLQLGIDVRHSIGTGADDEQHADMESVARLVRACRGLRRLTITQSALSPPRNIFSVDQLTLIRNHPALTHLDITCDASAPAFLYQCLNVWPNLTALRVSAFSLPPPPSHLPPACRLRELVAETLGSPSGFVAAAASRLAHLACTLNALHSIEHIEQTVCSLVVDCSFPCRAPGSSSAAFDALARCSALQSVTFRGGCPDGVLEALPDGVSHIRVLSPLDASRLEQVLRARPTVTNVEITMLRARARDDLARLQKLCHTRRIRLDRVSAMTA